MLFLRIIQRILVLIFMLSVNCNTENLAIQQTNESKNLLVRGRIFCFGSKLNQVPCAEKYSKIGLKDSSGQLYFLNSGESAKTLVKEKKLKKVQRLLVQRLEQMEMRLKRENKQIRKVMLKNLRLTKIKRKPLQRKNNLFYNLKKNL